METQLAAIGFSPWDNAFATALEHTLALLQVITSQENEYMCVFSPTFPYCLEIWPISLTNENVRRLKLLGQEFYISGRTVITPNKISGVGVSLPVPEV